MQTKSFNFNQQGATALESSLVCIPLVLFAALLLELTHSQHVRHIAQLALYEAARAGSVSGAHPDEIDQAFSTAILPLFVPAGRHGSSAKRRNAGAQKIAHETGLSLWQIETLNPDPFVFRDFSDAPLSRKLGRRALRNDYLSEQHQAHIRQGWLHGLGPHSGLTIFEANTLRLKLNLLYKPLTPGIAFILKKMGARRLDRTGLAWQKGYLVTVQVIEVVMQSHAQAWSQTPQHTQRVTKQAITPFASIHSQQHLTEKSVSTALGAPSAFSARTAHVTTGTATSLRNPLPLHLPVQGVKASMTGQRNVIGDIATVDDVAKVADVASVKIADVASVKDIATADDLANEVDAATRIDAQTEQNKLCDSLICCQ